MFPKYACLAATLSLTTGPALAQQSQNWAWCVNKNDQYSVDLSVSGCSAVIESGRENQKNLAIAFTNRCASYIIKKDFDRALTDCNQAIQLNPRDSMTFDNRGLAYAGKNDLDRALV